MDDAIHNVSFNHRRHRNHIFRIIVGNSIQCSFIVYRQQNCIFCKFIVHKQQKSLFHFSFWNFKTSSHIWKISYFCSDCSGRNPNFQKAICACISKSEFWKNSSRDIGHKLAGLYRIHVFVITYRLGERVLFPAKRLFQSLLFGNTTKWVS